MLPDQIAKSGTEHAHQVALFSFTAVAAEHGFEIAFLWANGTDTIQNIVKNHENRPFPALKWFHAIPNGGSRGDSVKSRIIRGAGLKAEGVRSGVADTFLPFPAGGYHGLYIELKKPNMAPKRASSSGGLTDEQKSFAEHVKTCGYCWRVCYSWREAAKILQAYCTL